MKKIVGFVAMTVALILTCVGCGSVNPAVYQSVGELASAFTVNDQQIMSMTRQYISKSDSTNKVSDGNSKYSVRLKRLTDPFISYSGLKLNFKVYMTDQINAFATADGSIRVYSGLMDVMTDDELVAILGHEIGHVVNSDVKDAMRTAALSTGAKNILANLGGTVGKLSGSVLGDVAVALANSQFSQKQELDADNYSFKFLLETKRDPYAMARALEKINSLMQGAQSSKIQQLFSTHPESAKRAARMRLMADEYAKTHK